MARHDVPPGPPHPAVGPGPGVPGVLNGPGTWYGAPAAVAAAVVAGTALLGTVDPSEPGHYPACPFRALTGFYCPGCGGLRAVHALVHGEWRQAVHDNALFVASLPVLVAIYVWWLRVRWSRCHGGDAAGPSTATTLVIASLAGAVMVVFGVLRNLPAFAVLAP